MFHHHCPPYAILSHTWGDHEASFEVFASKSGPLHQLSRLRRRRHAKVTRASALAKSQGYQWIWIDTCCIDKSSSAELSEAINSMYMWYQRAGVCYAYLADVSATDAADLPAAIARSRWFTRGWTLQELVAPPTLEFYDGAWTRLGTKASLADAVEAITSIPAGILSTAWQALCAGGLAQQSLYLLSVAQRLSWAADRQTTRPEDIAYCLMGLFDVHMPLLYGEGEAKAFSRLQAEIARRTNDQSLFAWGAWLVDAAECERLLCYELFAPHPGCFAGLGALGATSRFSSAPLGWTPPFEMPNDGYLRIPLRVGRRAPDGAGPDAGFMDDDHVAFLDCDVRGDDDTVVGLFVRRLDDAGGVKRYVRMHRLLGKFPRKTALSYDVEDILLGALPRHIPRINLQVVRRERTI